MNVLIVDYFGTIADPKLVDVLLKAHATDESFDGIYVNGAQRVLERIIQGDQTIAEQTRATFYPDVRDLFEQAKKVGLATKVYSKGNGEFVLKGLELIGVETGFIDPRDVGDKKAPESYQNIRKKYGYDSMIFVTDSTAEARAASDANLEYVVLVNPEAIDYTKAFEAIKELQKWKLRT